MNRQTRVLLLSTGLTTFLLAGCANPRVDVMPEPVVLQPAPTYEPVPLDHVRVSTYPPKGYYQIIALVAAEAADNEPLPHFLNRLQRQGASLGGDYVWLVGAQDDRDSDTEMNDPAYTGGHAGGNISSAYIPRHPHTRTAMTARVLKIFSGSTDPDTTKPSSTLR